MKIKYFILNYGEPRNNAPGNDSDDAFFDCALAHGEPFQRVLARVEDQVSGGRYSHGELQR